MKTENKKTLRGSVLFTVVCVMALLIIFLSGTLALASASNNRAHKSYAASQANYTARAAITSFTEAMQRDEGIVAAVQNMTGPLYPEVTIKETAGGANDGSIGVIGYYDASNKWHANQIIVEPMGYYEAGHEGDPNYFHKDTNWVYMDDGSGAKWTEVETVKITATCRVAKEEATISAYIKKKGSSGSQVPQTSKIKGLNTAGNGSFANGGRFTGGLGVGLKNNKPSKFTLDNACEIETSLTFVNGDLNAKTDTFYIDIKDTGTVPCSETVINGNLYIKNREAVQLNKQYEMKADYTQKQIPYLYINGGLTFGSQSDLVVQDNSDGHAADREQPYNVFAGTISTPERITIAGDLYLMDEYSYNEAYSIETEGQPVILRKGDNHLGDSGTSQLYRWVENTYDTDKKHNKTDTQNDSHGGSVYCNGNLTLSHFNVSGDVRVMGDCVIKDGVSITGNLVVGGTLYAESNYSAAAVYCDNVVDSSEGSVGYREWDNEYVPASDSQPEGLVKVDLPKRQMLEWNVGNHEGKTPGGGTDDAWKTVYYTWNIEYAPGMKLYQNDADGSFTYAYADENFTDEGYTFVGNVDDIISDAVNGQTGTWDDKTTYALNTFVNVDSGKLAWELNPQSVFDYTVMMTVASVGEEGPVYRETSIRTTDEFMWYDPSSQILLTDAETWEHQDAYYLKVDYDGNVTTERVSVAKSYYRESDHAQVSEYEATHTKSNSSKTTATINDYDKYGAKAYPDSMLRENIYGYYDAAWQFHPADNKTKIIKNLDEVRKEMDFDDATGEFKTSSYSTEVPADHDCSELAYKNNVRNTNVWSSKGYIKEDCTLKGTAPETITINPEGKTIWVVLDNFDLNGKDNGSYREIIVDLTNPSTKLQEGKVCFLIKGDLKVKGSAIVNKELIDGKPFDYTKDWGMEFFGEKNSRIITDQPCSFTGSFKCPFTSYTGDKNGIYTADYTDEYGEQWKLRGHGQTRGNDYTANKPPIVGNALFSEVINAKNDFGLYYTESGQTGNNNNGQGIGFSTALGYYELGYFSGS
jgi:hypothetical protein